MPPEMNFLHLPILLLSLLLCCCSLQSGSSADSELDILLNLKKSLGIDLQSWSPTNSPCNFAGVTCNSLSSVEKIDLSRRGISGNIPFSSLCSLPSLTNLTLPYNDISGTLTPDLSNCTGLESLDLSFNRLSGEIPDLSPLNKLQSLKLNQNFFTGPFPWSSLGNLTSLLYLSLGDNLQLDRSPFPEILTNLTGLKLLYLSDCNLEGPIPPSIGKLTELYDLELADNFLTGEFPSEIVKLTKLWQFEIYNNSLTGELPKGFGNLSNLAYFDASMNNLVGNLSEVRLLSNLISLQLFFNNFEGEIPQELGDFKFLVNLSLYNNRLTGSLPAKLGSWAPFNFIDVSTNSLTGEIPPDMCRMGTMKRLLILENQFTGEIPATYSNCTTLIRFRVSNNSLSGAVPSGIWSLPNLNILDLAINHFEGPIDAVIGGARSLNQLLVGENNFTGAIPGEISGASNLVAVDMSSNGLSGEIPASIGELKSLSSLALSRNELTGEIPASLGSCGSLNTVDLSHNSLSGEIPVSLGHLQSLNSLDLSNNRLSGGIPASLAQLKLSSLDLSNNNLAGGIPAALSISAYNGSFEGNPRLCSSSISYLKSCPSISNSSSSKLRTALTCLLVAFVLVLCSLGLLAYFKKHTPDQRVRKDSWDLRSFRVLSFDEQEIVGSITRENLIGKGGSANVYRVNLGNGKIVAVKHIMHSGAPFDVVTSGDNKGTSAMLTERSSSVRSREFEAEVGTLSSIRHVNVVKLYCSITSEESSLLVYEYLPNGSLWDRLHTVAGEKLGGLDWETRYEIAVGSARGLEYLHHGCDRPILHRDVKSSNILLDEFFKPRIADFGLAKILQRNAGSSASSTHVIAGTHGYIAPEYAYTWKVNEKSDVYSFGVVLMELVTGRRPIEAEYGDNKDIVYWISTRMTNKESIIGSLDASIISSSEIEEAVKVLKIAVLCTARLPAVRPSMRTVVQMLEDAGGSRLLSKVNSSKESFEKVKLEKVASYRL